MLRRIILFLIRLKLGVKIDQQFQYWLLSDECKIRKYMGDDVWV